MSTTPPPYDRQATFTSFHTEPAPTVGQDLEAEFNAVKQSQDATQSRLAEIQRDDGKLANLSVHPDALSNAVRSLLSIDGDIRGIWQTGLVYNIGDVIEGPDGITYLSTVQHVGNASFAVDVNAGRWISIDSGIILDAALRADMAVANNAAKGAALIGYTPTSTGVAGTVRSFLEALWSTGANLGAALIRLIQAGTGAIARTIQDKLRETVSPEDYGCLLDGITDDTVNMQKALDYLETVGGTLKFPRKKTAITGYCMVGPNTTIELNGSTWKAISSLGTAAQLLTNKNYTGLAVNATGDNNITIRNGEFHCDNAADRTIGLLEFIKTGDLRLENVRVRGMKGRGILLYGCKRTWITRSKISDYGKTAVTAEGGSGIHVTAHSDGSTSDDVYIDGNWINNGEWTAITATGNRISITNNRIVSVKEAGIFGTANELLVLGNVISDVTKKDISASGVELGGLYVTVANNVIREIGNAPVALTDVTNASVTGNRMINARRDAASFPTGAHIVVLSQTASPNQPRDIKISDNHAVDYSSPSTAAVRVEGSGAGSACVGIDISGNHFQGTAWTSGKGVYINPTYWTAANCSHRDNAGNDDTAAGCTATRSTTQSLTSGVAAVITFDAATLNSSGPTGTLMWQSGSNPSRITCHEAGRVVVTGQVAFTGAAGGVRQVNVLKNGTVAYAGCPKAIQNTVGAAYTQQVNAASGLLDVAAGDYFELQAMQDSGGALNTVGGISQTWLSVLYA